MILMFSNLAYAFTHVRYTVHPTICFTFLLNIPFVSKPFSISICWIESFLVQQTVIVIDPNLKGLDMTSLFIILSSCFKIPIILIKYPKIYTSLASRMEDFASIILDLIKFSKKLLFYKSITQHYFSEVDISIWGLRNLISTQLIQSLAL